MENLVNEKTIDDKLNDKIQALGIYYSRKKVQQLSRKFDINNSITVLDKIIKLVEDDDYSEKFLHYYKYQIKSKLTLKIKENLTYADRKLNDVKILYSKNDELRNTIGLL